ncbi:hypothetical protein NL676_027267 [Syzygium grande]|nr:hypothetical protein NL676_027267 [Syzygium grande]
MIFLFYASSPYVAQVSEALDTITVNQSIQDGESLVSAGGTFQLGFFSSGVPSRRYLGISYKKVTTMTVVWVANRDTPLVDSSGTLKFTGLGSLVLLNANGSEIWSSNSSTNARNPVAQLLDSGNLIVKDVGGTGSSILLWQSFDYPTDTLLVGMKMGMNRTTGFKRYLTSWKSIDDPSPGNFTHEIDPNGFPQSLVKQGSVVKFRLGPWNGVRYSGMPNQDPNPYYNYEFVLDDDEIYYHFELVDSSFISRLVLSSNGIVQRVTWIDRTQGWTPYLTIPRDNCDTYALCGAYGSCKIDASPVCRCLTGFTPKYSQEWDILDWSNGCVRTTTLDCGKDKFVKYSGVKLPDTSNSWFNKGMSLQECKEVCKKNCSCMAYSNLDIRGRGSGCLLWFGELIDIRELNQNGQDLYIRMAASESDLLQSKQKKQKLFMGLAVSFGVFSLFLVLTFCILQNKRKKMKHLKGKDDSFESVDSSECQKEDLELPVFDLGTVAIATNNFSEENKLGEGGFGPVYKAWRLFTEDRSMELLDELVESYNAAAVLRSIHVALLCVQQFPEDRPSMSAVILMLGSDNELPLPKEPGMKYPTGFILFFKMANDVFVAKHYSRPLLSLQMRGHQL